MVKPTEEEVITLLEYHGNCMTYQLANLIFANRFYKKPGNYRASSAPDEKDGSSRKS